jgi:hypothetical protein
LAGSCWYDVVVPRFRNENRSNDPPGTRPWPSAAEAPKADPASAYGGDLAGVAAKLDSIKDLGANALFLRSVFQTAEGGGAGGPLHVEEAVGAPNHAGAVDDTVWHFTAADRELLALVEKAHKAGLRVVLDADGIDRPPPESNAAEFEKRLLAATQRWMDPNGDGDPADGVDGWRITAGGPPPGEAASRWAALVKKTNPRAVLIGGQDALDAKSGATLPLDAVVNVGAGKWLNDFFRPGRSSPAPAKFLDQLEAAFRAPATGHQPLQLLPLRGAAGLESADPPAMPSANDVEARDLRRLAVMVQHLLPAAPVTFYGEEVGLHESGSADGFAPMAWMDGPAAAPWPESLDDLVPLVRWLHSRRQHYPMIREGAFRKAFVDEDRKLWAFARSLPGDELIVLVNAAPIKQKVMIPVGRPGQLIGLLIPQLLPASKPGKDRSGKPIAAKPAVLSVNGSRVFANGKGEIRLWISPMSIRIILVTDKELR